MDFLCAACPESWAQVWVVCTDVERCFLGFLERCFQETFENIRFDDLPSTKVSGSPGIHLETWCPAGPKTTLADLEDPVEQHAVFVVTLCCDTTRKRTWEPGSCLKFPPLLNSCASYPIQELRFRLHQMKKDTRSIKGMEAGAGLLYDSRWQRVHAVSRDFPRIVIRSFTCRQPSDGT